MNGDHGRAAALFAAMAQQQPDQTDLARKGLGEALGAGEFDLALKLARSIRRPSFRPMRGSCSSPTRSSAAAPTAPFHG